MAIKNIFDLTKGLEGRYDDPDKFAEAFKKDERVRGYAYSLLKGKYRETNDFDSFMQVAGQTNQFYNRRNVFNMEDSQAFDDKLHTDENYRRAVFEQMKAEGRAKDYESFVGTYIDRGEETAWHAFTRGLIKQPITGVQALWDPEESRKDIIDISQLKPFDDENTWHNISHIAGNVAPMGLLAMASAASLPVSGSFMAMVGLGALQQAGNQRVQILSQNLDAIRTAKPGEEPDLVGPGAEYLSAALSGIITMATEYLGGKMTLGIAKNLSSSIVKTPMSAMIKLLSTKDIKGSAKAIAGLMMSLGLNVTTQSTEEGIEEGVEQILNNLQTKLLVNEDQRIMEGVSQSIAMGAVGGALIGLPSGAIGTVKAMNDPYVQTVYTLINDKKMNTAEAYGAAQFLYALNDTDNLVKSMQEDPEKLDKSLEMYDALTKMSRTHDYQDILESGLYKEMLNEKGLEYTEIRFRPKDADAGFINSFVAKVNALGLLGTTKSNNNYTVRGNLKLASMLSANLGLTLEEFLGVESAEGVTKETLNHVKSLDNILDLYMTYPDVRRTELLKLVRKNNPNTKETDNELFRNVLKTYFKTDHFQNSYKAVSNAIEGTLWEPTKGKRPGYVDVRGRVRSKVDIRATFGKVTKPFSKTNDLDVNEPNAEKVGRITKPFVQVFTKAKTDEFGMVGEVDGRRVQIIPTIPGAIYTVVGEDIEINAKTGKEAVEKYKILLKTTDGTSKGKVAKPTQPAVIEQQPTSPKDKVAPKPTKVKVESKTESVITEALPTRKAVNKFIPKYLTKVGESSKEGHLSLRRFLTWADETQLKLAKRYIQVENDLVALQELRDQLAESPGASKQKKLDHDKILFAQDALVSEAEEIELQRDAITKESLSLSQNLKINKKWKPVKLTDTQWKARRDKIQEIFRNITEEQADVLTFFTVKLGLSDKHIAFLKAEKSFKDKEGEDTYGSHALLREGFSLIQGYAHADFYTGLHEIAHAVRRLIFTKTGDPNLRLGLSDGEIDQLHNWLGSKDGKLTKAQEELFANSFSIYMRDGESSNIKINNIFKKINVWLKDKLFHRVNQYDKLIPNPDIKAIFDKVLTRDESVEDITPVEPLKPISIWEGQIDNRKVSIVFDPNTDKWYTPDGSAYDSRETAVASLSLDAINKQIDARDKYVAKHPPVKKTKEDNRGGMKEAAYNMLRGIVEPTDISSLDARALIFSGDMSQPKLDNIGAQILLKVLAIEEIMSRNEPNYFLNSDVARDINTHFATTNSRLTNVLTLQGEVPQQTFNNIKDMYASQGKRLASINKIWMDRLKEWSSLDDKFASKPTKVTNALKTIASISNAFGESLYDKLMFTDGRGGKALKGISKEDQVVFDMYAPIVFEFKDFQTNEYFKKMSPALQEFMIKAHPEYVKTQHWIETKLKSVGGLPHGNFAEAFIAELHAKTKAMKLDLANKDLTVEQRTKINEKIGENTTMEQYIKQFNYVGMTLTYMYVDRTNAILNKAIDKHNRGAELTEEEQFEINRIGESSLAKIPFIRLKVKKLGIMKPKEGKGRQINTRESAGISKTRKVPTLDYAINESKIVRADELSYAVMMGAQTSHVAETMGYGNLLKIMVEEGLCVELPQGQRALPGFRSEKVETFIKKWGIRPVGITTENLAIDEDIFTYMIELSDVSRTDQGLYNRILRQSKNKVFINPLRLPLNDSIQALILGSVSPIGFKEAYNDYSTHSDIYMEMVFNGGVSSPAPFGKGPRVNEFLKAHKGFFGKVLYEAQRSVARAGNTEIGTGKVVNALKTPMALVNQVYNTSQDYSWKLDQVIRMMSYSHLRKSGYSAQQAGYFTALYHGDYANVPPKVRKQLNKIFFTPSFRISMIKLYTHMVRSVGKSIQTPDKIGHHDMINTKAVMNIMAINMAFDMFMMGALGFKREEWGRRYTKEMDTPTGLKNFVITFTNPANLIQNYLGKFGKIVDPTRRDKFKTFLTTFQYDFHPFYRVAFEAFNNYDNQSRDPLAPTHVQFSQTAIFMTRKLIPLFAFSEGGNITRSRSIDILQRETNVILGSVLSLLFSAYETMPKNVRLEAKITEINSLLYENRINTDGTLRIPTQKELRRLERILNDVYAQVEHDKSDVSKYLSSQI